MVELQIHMSTQEEGGDEIFLKSYLFFIGLENEESSMLSDNVWQHKQQQGLPCQPPPPPS